VLASVVQGDADTCNKRRPITNLEERPIIKPGRKANNFVSKSKFNSCSNPKFYQLCSFNDKITQHNVFLLRKKRHFQQIP